MMEVVAPILAGILVLVALWEWRSRTAERYNLQTRQLTLSAEMFEAHRKGLETFLSSPSAPASLKSLLVSCSDALDNKDVVVSLAQVFASPSRNNASGDEDEVVQQLKTLGQADPELLMNFASSLLSGTLGALLRWPETAKSFDAIGARLIADPKRDMSMAVAVSRFSRSNLPYGSPKTVSVAV